MNRLVLCCACAVVVCGVACVASAAEVEAKIYLQPETVVAKPGKPANFKVVVENPSKTQRLPGGVVQIVPPKGWKVNTTKIGIPTLEPMESRRPFFSLGIPPAAPARTYEIPVTVKVGKQERKLTAKIVKPAR